MKTIHLPLKSKWYKMIESGVKKEEYRDIKDHWIKRILWFRNYSHDVVYEELINDLKSGIPIEDLKGEWGIEIMPFSHVKFSLGYTKKNMVFEIQDLFIGFGNPEWGFEPDNVAKFIIRLGNKL